MKKKIISIVIIIMFLLTNFISLNAISKETTLKENTKTFLKDENSVAFNYIEASSFYDYGLKVGRRFRFQYKLLDIFARLTKRNNFNENDIRDQINAMDQYCPFFLEELKGLSDITNIRLERLLYLKNFLRSLGGCCTTMLATGPATKNDETFLINNIDNGMDTLFKALRVPINHLFVSRIFFIKDVSYSELDYKYIYRGIPILLEFPIMNEKGLSFGNNGIMATKNKSRYIDTGPGIDMDMLRRLTMHTCKNVTEVANLYKSLERMCATDKDGTQISDSTSWCDTEGGILNIEETHNYIITVFGNSTEITESKEGILWHTSHHQWLDPNLTGSAYPYEYKSSGIRAKRAHEILEKNYGNITLDVCKEMARDHGGGYNPDRKDSGDICRHPDKNKIIVTAYSFIINPKEFTIYQTRKSPCKGSFWQYNLSEKLGG